MAPGHFKVVSCTVLGVLCEPVDQRFVGAFVDMPRMLVTGPCSRPLAYSKFQVVSLAVPHEFGPIESTGVESIFMTRVYSFSRMLCTIVLVQRRLTGIVRVLLLATVLTCTGTPRNPRLGIQILFGNCWLTRKGILVQKLYGTLAHHF
jgi:hypothetical protein